MNFDTVNNLVASLATMKYFPSDPAARLALVELCGEMTDDEEKVRWLVKRLKTLYAEWPGDREMRACFCSKFKPKDGGEVHSDVYRDGIPSERPEPPKLLPPAGRHLISAAPSVDRAVRDLAASGSMTQPRRLPAPTVPEKRPNFKPITAEDVEREVEALRQRRAEAELTGGAI